MKKCLTLLMFTALVAGVSLSHAIVSIPINDVKASATLIEKDKNNYRPENLIMKKNVHPFKQTWGAPFNDKSVTLEFTMGAQQVSVMTLFNGNMRDSASYVNNSLAKTIKIYLNSKSNLVKTVTLAKPKWGGYKKSHPDVIVFDRPLENVRKIILEIEDIYPGKKWNDVCMAVVKFWGFVRVPQKFKMGKMKDTRDGNSYNIIKIGNQTWMAQDLRYKTPGSRSFTNPKWKKPRTLPADVGLEYPSSEIDDAICPSGWRLPKASEFAKLRSELPESASFDDIFATSDQKPFYSIYEYGNLGGEQVFPTDVEMFFYPTDAYGLNISTLTRYYYEGECSEDRAEYFAFSSYWTLDSKNIPLWPDENGNVEVKPLKHFRFGGSDYCEAMLCREDYHFVRCVKGNIMRDPRDGQAYETVKVENQTWMAENLRYETAESGCIDGVPENCAERGRTYSWNAAQTACPAGWHLPNDEEFTMLAESSVAADFKKGKGAAADVTFWSFLRPEPEADSSSDTLKALRYDVSSARFTEETGSEEPVALPVRCIKD